MPFGHRWQWQPREMQARRRDQRGYAAVHIFRDHESEFCAVYIRD